MRRLLLASLLLMPAVGFAQGSEDRVVESIDPKCMQRAIENRDTMVATNANTFNDTLRKLLKERKEDVSKGWGLSDDVQSEAAIEKAWAKYQKALSKAKNKRNSDIRATWKEFDRERRRCGQKNMNTIEPGSLQSDLQW